jgi:hypothetical protein
MFTFERAAAAAAKARAVSKVWPYANALRLVAADGRAVFSVVAPDYVFCAYADCPPGWRAEGVVDAATLSELCALAPVDGVEQADAGLVLRQGGSVTRLRTLSADLPDAVPAPAEGAFFLASAPLAQAVRWAAAAVSRDEVRPALAHVSLTWGEGTLLVEASDGYRAHRVVRPLEAVRRAGGTLIHRSALRAAYQVLDADHVVALSTAADGQLWLVSDSAMLYLRPSEARARMTFFPLPDWMFQPTSSCFDVDADALRAALKMRLAEGALGVHMCLKGGALTVSAQGGTSQLPADGDDQEAHLNPQYLLDALLPAGRSERAALSLDARSRCTVTTREGAFAVVVMPMEPRRP